VQRLSKYAGCDYATVKVCIVSKDATKQSIKLPAANLFPSRKLRSQDLRIFLYSLP